MEGNTSRNGGGVSGDFLMKKPTMCLWTKRGNNDSEEGASSSGTSAHDSVPVDFFKERKVVGGIRVGRDYQAKIPTVIQKQDRRKDREEDDDLALLVWRPTKHLTDEQIDSYVSMAKEKFHYTGEQALGLLFWHRFDMNEAKKDLQQFYPHIREEWSVDDRALFESAFKLHGKKFDEIQRHWIPYKSMKSIIRYYYTWKTENKNKLKKFNYMENGAFLGAETHKFGAGKGNTSAQMSVLENMKFEPTA